MEQEQELEQVQEERHRLAQELGLGQEQAQQAGEEAEKENETAKASDYTSKILKSQRNSRLSSPTKATTHRDGHRRWPQPSKPTESVGVYVPRLPSWTNS